MLQFLFILIFVILAFYLWEVLITFTHVKPIALQSTDLSKYCIIDIRDFNISHRNPFNHGENIPLSYLPRTAREKGICDKDIIFITDDRKAAGKAARIVSKVRKREKKQFFYTTVETLDKKN